MSCPESIFRGKAFLRVGRRIKIPKVVEKIVYFAHSANRHNQKHVLCEHLKAVGNLARKFAGAAPWGDEAELSGLKHDIGKYGDRFPARLRGEDSGLDHWSQGAWHALNKYHALAAALAIEGHHIGLQQGNANSLKRLLPANLINNHWLHLDLSGSDMEGLVDRARADGLEFVKPKTYAVSSWERAVCSMLDVRLLFSCLVDADFLDTEAHFNGDARGKQYRPAGPRPDAAATLAALNCHKSSLNHSVGPGDAKVLAVRESLWKACGVAAERAPGLFTLTAPTGSGKTLGMLRFGLEHAARHKLKRIVLVVPFLTIIDQTARIYHKIFSGFPRNFVLEHHSLAGLGEESEKSDAHGPQERQRRLLSENWDVPIVLTTNVQLLESLFSNRPSACRKLHNLMESVILFDEAQSLPQHLAVPTLAALSHLSTAYATSVVFATATQPAFSVLDTTIRKHAIHGWKPEEIVPDHAALFEKLRRVKVFWPRGREQTTWRSLAKEVQQAEQVLVVLNLKRHALVLLGELEGVDGVFHLSTNLCAKHRRAVLDIVRARLKQGLPCRLISTQCVEAGVDVDFPKVFRAFAPLEAIVQAAGRCNREGRLNEQGKLGELVVFTPEENDGWRCCYPTHAYYQAAEVTRTILIENSNLDINDPEIFQAYYKRLYDLNNPASQNADLVAAIQALDFVEVARLYRIIEQAAIQVLIPWQERLEDFNALGAEADQKGISADWMRRAQGLAVSVYRSRGVPPAWVIPAKLQQGGVSDEWFILEGNYYDSTVGLNPPEGSRVFIA
jgi:CRISPR-associated helicase Cas3/CRISPR-associated endonuclease Cas3-HD